jgi:hypothetical protein
MNNTAAIHALNRAAADYRTRQTIIPTPHSAREIAQMDELSEYLRRTHTRSRFGCWIDNYDPYNLPVQVCGALQGYVSDKGIGVEQFENIRTARGIYPDLRTPDQIDSRPSRFNGPMRGEINGHTALRYESSAAYKLYSS